MPKTSPNSQTASQNRAAKLADVFQILRDLRPGERIPLVPPPPLFAREFRIRRQAACRSLRRYGVLRNGQLFIYTSQQDAEKNRVWRVVDLTKCIISYRLRDKRILVQASEAYRLKVEKKDFRNWVDNLRTHRLYGQAKTANAEQITSDAKAPVPTPPVAPSKPQSPSPKVLQQVQAANQTKANDKSLKRVETPAKGPEQIPPKTVSMQAPKQVTSAPAVVPPPALQEAIAQAATAQAAPTSARDENEQKPEKSSTEDSVESAERETAMAKVAPQQVRSWRVSLPAQMNPPPSLWSLIASMIGKDIMRMAVPVSVMEPLSTLQVLCEEFEYSDLIDKALTQSDPVWRMTYISAFAMSRYGSTAQRVGRKPFNPLLGETFEYQNLARGWRFLAEQVSHHPPVAAVIAEGRGWRFWHDCELSASMSARAVKVTPIGRLHLRLEEHGETYTWSKVLTQVTGILSRNYVIDHIGEMVIACQKTKFKTKLNFKDKRQRRGDVEGQALDEKGQVLRKISGNWTESLNGDSTCVWRITPMPPDHEKYFGFTRFALSLNEVRPDVYGKLPKTDSRFRPDQRALEMGKADEADKLKRDLEERQRQRRKVNEAANATHTPLWFTSTGNTNAANGSRWKYNGKYWQAKKDQFQDVEFLDLW